MRVCIVGFKLWVAKNWLNHALRLY
jgi:hypothetical protein